MIKDPKVSIIVPVFNGEEYLDRCLSSIVSQSYKNIEIIIINDGSTDNTKTICECYLQKEPRVKIIYKENEGVSVARNLGLDSAIGEYIYFVDADDYILENGVEELIDKAIESLADLVVAEYYVASSTNKDKVTPLISKDSNDFLCSVFSGKNHSALWNKLFNRKLFKEIRFPIDIVYIEDKIVISQILMTFQPKIEFLSSPVYVYWQHTSSVTSSKNESVLDIFHANLYIAKLLKDFTKDRRIISVFVNGAYNSTYFVLRNIDIDCLDKAMLSALDFHSELAALGFSSPTTKKGLLSDILFKMPLSFATLVVKKIRLIREKLS